MRLITLLLMSLLGAGLSTGCGARPAADPRLGTIFPQPSITALTPNATPVNSVPFTMTVNGSQFGTDAIVFWNGVAQHTIAISSNQLLVSVTDADLMFTGLVKVFVRTGGINSNTMDFDVTSQ